MLLRVVLFYAVAFCYQQFTPGCIVTVAFANLSMGWEGTSNFLLKENLGGKNYPPIIRTEWYILGYAVHRSST